MESILNQPEPSSTRNYAKQRPAKAAASTALEATTADTIRSRLSSARSAHKSKTLSNEADFNHRALHGRRSECRAAHNAVHNPSPLHRLSLEHHPPPDAAFLKDLCNDVRRTLRDTHQLGPRRDELMEILGNAVRSECDGRPMVPFDTIDEAHVDKLLLDMLNPEHHPKEMPMQLRADFSVAESLQRQWRACFREDYSGLDNERRKWLTEPGGRLENMVFNEHARNNNDFWHAKKSETLSEHEGNDTFREGHWWVNMACAHRDGILCHSRKVPSQGEFDIPTLPLLDGSEMAIWPDGDILYTREGALSDMWLQLITHTGKRVRLLRGHLLKSPFAPKVGLRYDGQYKLARYGQHESKQSGKLMLRLILKRVEGQTPMHELVRLPKQSQIDDWVLVEQLEGELVISRCGERRFLEWKAFKDQEKLDKTNMEQVISLESVHAIEDFVQQCQKDGKDSYNLGDYRRLSDLRWTR